jgi:hypothetical protein
MATPLPCGINFPDGTLADLQERHPDRSSLQTNFTLAEQVPSPDDSTLARLLTEAFKLPDHQAWEVAGAFGFSRAGTACSQSSTVTQAAA